MNVSSSRPRLWTPQTITIAVLLHAALIYYLAVAFKIVLPPDLGQPPVIRTVTFSPPPPPVDRDPDPIINKKPLFQQRPTPTPPITTTVPPSPFAPTATPDRTGPTTIAVGEDIPEQPVLRGLPLYPRIARDRDIEGRVVMSITILPDGSVRDVQVVESSPRGYFENSAVRAVQTWRYRPSNVTRTNVIVHMDFVLKDT